MHDARRVGHSGRAYAALLAAALAAAGAAQQAEETEPAGAREPRACLSHPTIRRTKILDDRNIVFMTRDESIYANQLPKACSSLRRNSLVSFNIVNKRICGGDYFQVLWETTPMNYTPGFVCQLGAFVPITEVELEDLTAMTEPSREKRARRRSTREAVTTQQVELPPAAGPAEARSPDGTAAEAAPLAEPPPGAGEAE